MRIDELLELDLGLEIYGSKEIHISRVVTDSREVQKGDLFFAKVGTKEDGIQYVNQAIQKGASAIFVPEKMDTSVTQLVGDRSFQNLKKICTHLYKNPTQNMFVVGVTGTNGKTSTCHFIEAFLKQDPCGYLGTTQYRWPGVQLDAKLTTPTFESLQYYFYQMHKSNVASVVMECSSHGIELDRIDAIDFDICLFSNLSHEHLDFHNTMDEYAESKKKLFTKYLAHSKKKNKIAIINFSDSTGKQWIEEKISPTIYSFGLDDQSDAYPLSVETTPEGMTVKASILGEKMSFFMPTLGMYNVMNVLSAILVGKLKGLSLDFMKETIEAGIYVPGRLEKVKINAPFTVLVDYAYTEDALRNVLKTLKPFRKNRIITVFGCGGDRDRTRRPKMARAVYEVSDQLIVTTDNPRTEDPANIIEEIKTGILSEPDYTKRVHIEVDRKNAIIKALSIAQKDDIVLIAGKGHETYQEVHGVRHPFDDKKIVQEYWSTQ